MADVFISLDRLETMSSQLGEIIEEFESAEDRSEELQDAIDTPFSRADLQDLADEFEDRWDLERDQLKDGLTEIRDHLDAVIEGVEEWDSETALSLESGE